MKFSERSVPYNNRRMRLIAKAFLEAEQEGRCAICGSEGPLVVDHDHATGVIRGLLCNPCNLAIGMMQEHPKRLLIAIDYLGWSGRMVKSIPRCEECGRRLAEFVSGVWSIRCPRCKHQNASYTVGHEDGSSPERDAV